jgi:Tfp pilus assembly protein PilZ
MRKGVMDLPVVVKDDASRVEAAIRFDARDLSVGGAFLRSDLLFEIGEEIDISFRLPEGAEVRARARVVHVVRETGHEAEAGMGIAFTQLPEADRERVRAFLRNHG